MIEKQTVIKLYLDGISKRKIAKKTGKSRNTVDKYILEYEESKTKDVQNLPIAEDIVKPPTYKKRKDQKNLNFRNKEYLTGIYKRE